MLLALAVFYDAPTARKMATSLRTREALPIAPTAILLRPGGDQCPIFCVPGSGADVLTLRALSKCLVTSRSVYGLQPRGMDGIASPFLAIKEMAESYLADIREIQPVGPYYLAGFSAGALVAP